MQRIRNPFSSAAPSTENGGRDAAVDLSGRTRLTMAARKRRVLYLRHGRGFNQERRLWGR